MLASPTKRFVYLKESKDNQVPFNRLEYGNKTIIGNHIQWYINIYIDLCYGVHKDSENKETHL